MVGEICKRLCVCVCVNLCPHAQIGATALHSSEQADKSGQAVFNTFITYYQGLRNCETKANKTRTSQTALWLSLDKVL